MNVYRAAVELIRAQDVARELARVGKANQESMREVRDRLADYREALSRKRMGRNSMHFSR